MGFMGGVVREMEAMANGGGDYQTLPLASRAPFKHHAPP